MKKAQHNNKEGLALVVVLIIIATLSSMLGMLTNIGRQRTFTSKKMVSRIKAQAYAEAGIDSVYSRISNDFEMRNDPALSGEVKYAKGTYTITITPVNDKYVIVNSLGNHDGTTTEVEILIDDENAQPDWKDSNAWEKAIAAGGGLALGGTGSTIAENLNITCNGAIVIAGNVDAQANISSPTSVATKNPQTIVGTVTSPNLDLGTSKVTGGAAIGEVIPVSIPDIDLTPYYNTANKNGEVIIAPVDGLVINKDTAPAGGILWVEGDVTLSAQAEITGAIIATGNVNIKGDVDIDGTAAPFAVASRDGDIYNQTSGAISGLIYGKTGDYTQTSNGEIYGQIIVAGDVQKTGTSSIINYVDYNPADRDDPSAWPVIGAWQK